MSQEQQYLSTLQNILDNGITKEDRTGVGTISSFAEHMRFDISKQFMLLTTKKVFLRGIFHELIMFMKGQTDSIEGLEKHNVGIWKGNTRREFLDAKGLDYLPEGEMGCTYPHQWRNFGGPHPLVPETKDCLPGFDQLASIIDKLRNNPTDRRMELVGANPQQAKYAALPACHSYAVFYADPKRKILNCHLTQRSADTFLGVPFNIAQYNLLTIFLAKITGFTPGVLDMTFVDCHIYSNHVEAVKEQLTRSPRDLPTLTINKELKELDDILNLEFSDLILEGYDPYPSIKAEMAV
jgi:thymidylate synthase